MKRECSHPKIVEIGYLPPAKFPLPITALPSHIQDEIEEGTLVLPKIAPFTLPRRAIWQCTQCGLREVD